MEQNLFVFRKIKRKPLTANKISTIIMMLALCQHCRIIPTFYNAKVEGSTDSMIIIRLKKPHLCK